MVLIQMTFEAYGPYIKYVGGEAGGFLQIFQKIFRIPAHQRAKYSMVQ